MLQLPKEVGLSCYVSNCRASKINNDNAKQMDK